MLKLVDILLMWMMDFEAPRIYRPLVVIWRSKGTGKRVLRHNQSTADRRGPALKIQGLPIGVILRYFLEGLESERTIPSLDFMMENQLPIRNHAVLVVELVWRHDTWYPCRL